MRWYDGWTVESAKWYGTERIVRRFLWFPYTLRAECRWLEWVRIRQVWRGALLRSEKFYAWDDLEFVGGDDVTE